MIHTRPSRHISKSSIFAAARSIPRVGQQRVEMPEDFEDEPSYGAVLESLGLKWERNKGLPVSDLPRDIASHLGYSHHDTRIQDVLVSRDEVAIKFNHYDLERIAANIVDYCPRWRKLQRAFPVKLRLSGVSELHWLETVENSLLRKITHSFRRIKKAFYMLIMIYAFRSDGGQLGVVVDVYRLNWFKRKGWRRRVCDSQDKTSAICVGCADISVDSNIRDQWAEVFGEDGLFILDRFLPNWPEKTGGWMVPDMQEWLKTEFVGEDRVRLDRASEHCLRWLR